MDKIQAPSPALVLSDTEKAYLLLTGSSYVQGTTVFSYKDCVSAMYAGYKGAVIKGRLLQVRRGQGACGTDMFLIRTPSGELVRVENDRLVLLPNTLPMFDYDSLFQEYTLNDKHPATGFIV